MNIEQRRGLWYAVVMVPKDLRSTYGIKFLQSLQTRDRLEAEAKALPIVARWKRMIKEARDQSDFNEQKIIGQPTPLGPLLRGWEADANIGKRALDQVRHDLEKLISHFETVEVITPMAVELWIRALVAAGYTHSSLDRIVKSCMGLWDYLRKTSVIDPELPDPFAGITSLAAAQVERS